MSETCAAIIASVMDAFKNKFWTASLHQELKLEQSQESAYNSQTNTESLSQPQIILKQSDFYITVQNVIAGIWL